MASFAHQTPEAMLAEYQTVFGLVDGETMGFAVTSMGPVIAWALPETRLYL